MARSKALFLHLGLVLSVHCCLLHMCLAAHELTQTQEDIDSNNNFLKNYIWARIISAPNKNSPTQSPRGSSPPRIPQLVTIPYKPASSSSSLSRRSSYSQSSSGHHPSQNPTASASSSSYSYEPSGSIAAKYFTESKSGSSSLSEQPFGKYNPIPTREPSVTTAKPPAAQMKSSYSGSESGKSYFVSAFAQSPSEPASASTSFSKSLYDLVPMPTYGIGKFGGGPEQNNLYQSKRTLEIVPMIGEQGKQYGPPMEPQIIEVAPDDQPIQVVFRSTSTRVQVKQIHTPTKPEEVETTRTEEEPQRVVHQLLRPVIQEVFEVIQPYRKVTQEVRPVLEEVHTVVSKASPNGGQGQGQQGPGNGQGMYGPNGNGLTPPFRQSFGQNFNSNHGNNQQGNHGAYGGQRNY